LAGEPQKVVTEHEGANAAIAQLRDTAKALKELGDEVLELRSQLASMEEESVATETVSETFEQWTEVLEDFRRGIRDRDELLERTVGL
jgi:hypothetical protein